MESILNPEQIKQLSAAAMALMPQIAGALITLVVGLWIAGKITRMSRKAMEKGSLDASLVPFLASLLGFSLKGLVLIIAAGMVGIETASLIAVAAAASFAVGMALQGSLSHLAGGVMIMVFRPFKVGDVIEAQGFIGSVSEIGIFNTILKTGDNKTIIIPNGSLSSGNITNYTTEKNRRVDMTFGIAYDDNIGEAKQILRAMVNSDEKILKEPETEIYVSSLGDSSVNISVRAWTLSSDYWPVFFDWQEKVKNKFDQEGITIPYPQRDTHVFHHKTDDDDE